MKTTFLLVPIICSALSSCAGAPVKRELSTRVDREMVLPQAAARYENKDKQVFFLPITIDSPMPSYSAAIAEKLDREVILCTELTVSEQGEVSSVDQIEIDSQCAPPQSQEGLTLFPLVVEAVKRWTFFAGGRCAYEVSKSECEATDANIDPVAVKLAYKFSFRKGGVGVKLLDGKSSSR